MIQTINQEEKSKTEFIAFDEDNGSVLASESLGKYNSIYKWFVHGKLDDLRRQPGHQ